MALILGDRIKETTTVAGTGTATLLGATTGFQSFAAVGNGNTTYYCIADQGGPNWEVGIGTYTASGTTLARTTVLASSNAGALVVFTTGVKDVFVTYPAEKGVWLDASNNAIGLGTPAAFVATNVTGLPLTTGVTGTLPVANGGTGVTTSTGTGSTVLSASPTFTGTTTAANLAYTGTLTGGTGVIAIGTNQIYKDTSGNVGIGTSNPSAPLDIKVGTGNFTVGLQGAANAQLTASGTLRFNTTAGTTVFSQNTIESVRIDASGNVGIGTSSPSYRLEVKGASATAGQLSIHDGTGDTTVSGVTAGSLLFQARDSSIRTIAEIDVVNTTTNGTGGAMVFQTRIADALAERMRIDSSGNVGINCTASTSAILDAQSTTKGVRFPNMTTTQKTAISSPAAGLVVFDTTLAKLCVYSGAAWQTITSI